MKFIVLISFMFIFTGYKHIETLKGSFGYIRSHYKLVKKNNYICQSCISKESEFNKINKINIQLLDSPYIKGTGFVFSHKNNKTHILTAGHVCESLDAFLKEEKFKQLTQYVQQQILDKSLFPDDEVRNSYQVMPVISVSSFSGEVYKISKVVSVNKEHDLCYLLTNEKWGKIAKLATEECEYEEIYNMSASGGFYEINTIPLRKGFINSKIKKQQTEDDIYYNVNLYTLDILPGSSGSAVFNKNGNVCGSINIAYSSLGLSSGPSLPTLKKFLDSLKEEK